MSFNPAGGALSGASDVALNNPAEAQALMYNGTNQVWENRPVSGGSSDPRLITPPNNTTDIGPLINTALQTYGVAIVAACPGSYWTLNTPISIGLGEALIGYGQGTSILRAGTGLIGQPMIQLRTGSAAHFTIRGLQLLGLSRASQCIYLYCTAQPTTAATNPDGVAIIDDVFASGATADGIYVGGSGAYSGNLRESRILNCIVKGNGGPGITVASSDCFLFNNTTHGNGGIGYSLVAGQAGNAKLTQCKAYFEAIGIDAAAGRVTITGGEVQDCTTYGVRLGANCYLAMTIDTCGDATTPGLYVNGTGCTFAVHMVGRNPPNTNVINAAIQLATGSQIHAGFINTNVLLGGVNYDTQYQNANRPATGSTLVVS
ncbi:MAG TPA: right-handed parallel beta-helix repeat-containing protein [Candidatus Saccharimonadales bacterium]|jgi:parallel beta-helix repeat protein